MAADHGWVGSQWTCLDQLWGDYESGWRTNAGSPSAAYGIPQSYPGNKMRSEGADWMTNPVTQIKWGIGYIQSSYHNDPCAALYKRLHSSPPGY
jgi:resuscitation-promoting factor RpfB